MKSRNQPKCSEQCFAIGHFLLFFNNFDNIDKDDDDDDDDNNNKYNDVDEADDIIVCARMYAGTHICLWRP